jgi:hypothetical protein
VHHINSQYLRYCKAGKWKKGSAKDALKCYNFERVFDTEMFGLEEPSQITLDDYMGVVQGTDINARSDVGVRGVMGSEDRGDVFACK